MKPTDEIGKLTTILTESIQQGFPVLIENVGESLGSMFESILEKNKKKQGGILMMKFMDKFYSFNEDFQFFVTTKLANPHYPPEICAQVTLLNFQVTPEGLEDQLINLVVVKEHTSMANKWQGLIKRYYELMKRTKETEELILDLLSKQSGNILDDEVLIKTLNDSKKSSKEAELGLNDIEMNRKKIKKISENYKDCGFRVSNLFFCVTDMANVEPMYQFSLDWFMDLYAKAIATEPKVKDTRVQDIVRVFTQLLFQTVSRSLFEKDKLLFSFLIFLKVLFCDGTVTQKEIRKLLLVNIVNTKSN
jgi:dynein heavy chain